MNNNPYGFGNELSSYQIDQALTRLSHLMKGEEKQIMQNNQSDILRSIQKMAIAEVIEEREQENAPKITVSQLNQLIGRIYDKHQQTQERLNQQREEERLKSPFKPTISSTSQKIIQRKMQLGEYQPIQQRAQQIQYEKKQKQDHYQKMKTQEEDIEKSQYTFRPNVKIDYEPRSVDQFLEQVDYWIMKKNQTIQSQQQEKLERELREATFKPKVNKNSEKIVSESKDLNTTVQERLQKSTITKQMKERKMVEEELKKTPFQPKININSRKILNKTQLMNQSPFQKQHNYVNHSMLEKSLDQQMMKETLKPLKTQRDQSKSKSPGKPQLLKTPQRSKTPLISKTHTQVNTPVRNKTPLRNNKSILNQQRTPNEIKYSPNLKFIVDLLDKRPTRTLF